jgi:hypothetical protein
MLFQPFTVVKKDSVSTIQNVLNKISFPGYPLPNARVSIDSNSIKNNLYFDEIGAANMYNKQIGRIDYRITPSNLKNQNEFWFNEKVRNILMQYPLLYAADTAVNTKDTTRIIGSTKKIALLEDATLVRMINNGSSPNASESRFTYFSPNSWQVEIENDQPLFYTIFQNYYPRWQLKIDGKKEGIVKSNIAFMGFYLPAGKHSVNFYYEATDIKIAFFISLLLIIVIVVYGSSRLIFKRTETKLL